MRSEIFNITGLILALSIAAFVTRVSWDSWQNRNSPKYKHFYLEYMDGKSSFYNRPVSDIEIKTHLNVIIIHSGKDDVYIPMHNLRFFGMADTTNTMAEK
jgi:hypothetical protein